jgi:hypothetical protein
MGRLKNEQEQIPASVVMKKDGWLKTRRNFLQWMKTE